MINRIRKSFARAEECKHGGKVQEAAAILGREPLDFSANINPLGSPPLEELICKEIENIAHYPDNSYRGLCRAAAKFVDVEGAIDDKAAGGYAVEQTEEFKQRQAQAIHNQAIKSDVIICTAQIPGRKAPLLIKKETVEAMVPGSVIIDLAASTGGNCELTKNNETIVHNGVKIIGNSQFPTDIPTDASRMFGKNVINFLKLIITAEGGMNLNWDDDIVKGTAVTHGKEIVHERVKSVINQ